jgi:hypothetical protein
LDAADGGGDVESGENFAPQWDQGSGAVVLGGQVRKHEHPPRSQDERRQLDGDIMRASIEATRRCNVWAWKQL